MRKPIWRNGLLLLLAAATLGLGSLIGYNHIQRVEENGFLEAVQHDRLDEVRAILERKPYYIRLRDKIGRSALHVAIEAKQAEMVKLLLAFKPDVNAQIDGHIQDYLQANGSEPAGYLDTPLHDAVETGDLKLVSLLLDQQAEIDVSNEQDWTPLHLSVLHKHTEIAKLLLQHGSDVNASGLFGQRPLHLAAQNNQPETVQLLLANHADASLKDEMGFTPLKRAQETNQASPSLQSRRVLALLSP